MSENDSHTPDTPRVIAADFSLKKKIGMDFNIASIFTPERIAEAQQAINEKQTEFMDWANRDIEEMERAFNDFTAMPDAAFFELDHIRKLAFSLKCQAGTFGFALASEIARSLHNYMSQHKEYSKDKLAVVSKHIDALKVVIMQNIQGDGGITGRELNEGLRQLTEKFA